MSNISLIIEERAANIGNFMVGRLLPFREKRAVGPFVFIDHMGPAHLSDHENMDVPPHPHIGLSTLTFLFEGSIMHRDSLGTELEIKPGAVNWMTAGKGIVHSERTPEYLRHSDKMLHGLQIWVALPKELEQMDPNFAHVEASDIPHWEENGVSYKLIAGEAFGQKSPVPVYSPLYFIEIKSETTQKINIGKDLKYDADAIGQLQNEIVHLGNEHINLFLAKLKALPYNQTAHLINLLADVENHKAYPEYQQLIDLLKKRGEVKIANQFITARTLRMKVRDH